ncbi:hypothetical protein [Polaromonas aquatica]|uniref:hypothetical protein n=1 Tax=Polaromonas aquatica TaxID=332657 RepID=UPI003D649649
MTTSTPLFVVDDEMELLALWRLVAEARFAEDPDDTDLWGSRYVNELSKRIGAAMREAARRSSRPGEIEKHERWVLSLRENIALPVVKRRLREDARSAWWAEWSQEEKQTYVRDCVSPFRPDSELVEELIYEAEA